MRKIITINVSIVSLLFFFLLYGGAQPPNSKSRPDGSRKPRAELPQFNEKDLEGVFFKDLFKDGLQGQRPADLGKLVRPAEPANRAGNSESRQANARAFGWSKIISATTVEDEVKAIKLQVDQEITTPGQFAARGYKAARRRFSVLALMFGVVSEYDGEVRWKKDAPTARDAFAQTARNCKAGAIQVYNEAKLRKTQLQDLIRGASLTTNQKATPKSVWPEVSDRSPLMQRLESAYQTNLQPSTSNKSSFLKNNEKVFHEAEIIAALAEIITKEGMEDSDDETYVGFAKAMKKAARDVAESVRSSDYETARKAVGAIGQACSQCHETYKG